VLWWWWQWWFEGGKTNEGGRRGKEEIASVWVSSLDKFADEMESQKSSRYVHVQTNDTVNSRRTQKAREETNSESSDGSEKDRVSHDGTTRERNEERSPGTDSVRQEGDADVHDGSPAEKEDGKSQFRVDQLSNEAKETGLASR